MTEAEIALLAQRPGIEGVVWRLVRVWNPDRVGEWLVVEDAYGTAWPERGRAMGEVMAAAAFGFGLQTDNPREAIVGGAGIVKMFQASLQAKVNHHNAKSPGGVYLPTPGAMNGS